MPFRRLVLSLLIVLPMLGATPLVAAPEGSGLPVPRFVSLRADKANLRTGPGEQYPIRWVYERPGLPLEILAEYYNWRRVRDWQGGEGWMHSSVLTGRRYAVITGGMQTVRVKADPVSSPVARAETGVIARLLQCPTSKGWCQVEVKGIKGWLPRDVLWGVYPDEVLD